MKKKILALCLCAAMLSVVVIGGTLAYFTDTDDNTNVFTVGNVDIVLDEAPVEKNGDKWEADKDADRIQSNTYELIYPGAVLPKDPTVHNVGKNDAYVRVKISMENGITILPTFLADDTYSDTMYKEAFLAMIGGTLGENWTIVDYTDGMDAVMNSETTFEITIMYALRLESETDTTPVFEAITIPASWTQDDLRVTTVQETGIKMDIVAEAIQAEGFTSAEAAFVAYDAQN